jgi:ligand-binding SRPBCC domain-containing protein
MPTIHLTTFIQAPAARVFDLARSIDLHKLSMEKFREEPVAGIRSGLIEQGETVTWRARHLFKNRLLRARITEMKRPEKFVDEQAEGDFRFMRHEHYFKPCENGTILIDLFHFETPYGWLGKMVNSIYLNNYMKRMLEHRNEVIKKYAESDQWRKVLQ